MDGYVRLNTDENGKILDIWDEWYRDERIHDYIIGCGLEDYLREYNFAPNSLILVTFKLESEINYSYMDGEDYSDWLEIQNEIVLIKDYKYEDMEGVDDRNIVEDILMEWRPND